jgi:hypothetical protein
MGNFKKKLEDCFNQFTRNREHGLTKEDFVSHKERMGKEYPVKKKECPQVTIQKLEEELDRRCKAGITQDVVYKVTYKSPYEDYCIRYPDYESASTMSEYLKELDRDEVKIIRVTTIIEEEELT